MRGKRGLQQVAEGIETWRETRNEPSQATGDKKLEAVRSTATLKPTCCR